MSRSHDLGNRFDKLTQVGLIYCRLNFFLKKISYNMSPY